MEVLTLFLTSTNYSMQRHGYILAGKFLTDAMQTGIICEMLYALDIAGSLRVETSSHAGQ